MRSIIDNKFSNLIKSNLSLKTSKNSLVKLRVFIENEENIKIEPAFVKRKLADFSRISLTEAEFGWLETTKMFEPSFLTWLKNWRFPKFNLIEEENGIAIEVEVPFSEAILTEKIMEACLSEARFAHYLKTTGEEEGRFFAFGSDRYNIKVGGFLNSKNIIIIEDAVGLRPASDWYSLLGIFMSASPFSYMGTTNAYHAMALAQPVVTYCDDPEWLEAWPDSNFSPNLETYDPKKYRGFVMEKADAALAVELRTKYPDAILISPESSVFDMAHTTAHVGKIMFLWSQELVQDLNIEYYKPVTSWQK